MGAHATGMILAAENVVDLQFFLMDAAKQYAPASGSAASTDELLSNAAALDYALLLSSQHADEPIDDASPVGMTMRDTMTRAALAALDFVETMLRATDEVFDDFVERHIRRGGLFDTIRSMRERGVAGGDELAFRTLTLADALLERRKRG